jgi:hypothetical protein
MNGTRIEALHATKISASQTLSLDGRGQGEGEKEFFNIPSSQPSPTRGEGEGTQPLISLSRRLRAPLAILLCQTALIHFTFSNREKR